MHDEQHGWDKNNPKEKEERALTYFIEGEGKLSGDGTVETSFEKSCPSIFLTPAREAPVTFADSPNATVDRLDRWWGSAWKENMLLEKMQDKE